jgi:hypothetical protein
LLYAIPLIALVAIAAVYVVFTLPTPPAPAAMNFTFQLLLEKENVTAAGVQGIIPDHAIGETGGYWASNQFDSYEVDSSHYPIYMDTPPTACPNVVCTIHVKSRVVYNYTLGDFFQVWGIPLGENDTWNLQNSGRFAWMLCIGPDPSTATISTAWGLLVLQSGMQLTIEYVDYTSPYTCAAV